MFAISIPQPLAQEISQGARWTFARGFTTTYRGALTIHASGQPAHAIESALLHGYCLAVVQLLNVVTTAELLSSDEKNDELIPDTPRTWRELAAAYGGTDAGRPFLWIVSDPVLITPVRWRGRFGLWHFDDRSKG